MSAKVQLKINDEDVPLNNYVTQILSKVNFAIVETLKGIDLEGIETITINIENTN